METKGHAYFMIEEVNSYPINIYTISPVSLFGCVNNFGRNIALNNCNMV